MKDINQKHSINGSKFERNMNLETARGIGKSLKAGISVRLLFLIICVSLLTAVFAMSNKAQTPLDGFEPSADNFVNVVAVQPDGKIVVGGWFTSINGEARGRLARLNPDGSLDMSFAPDFDNEIRAVKIQSDGKILVGGRFNFVNGVARGRLARLNADGSLDTGFTDPTSNNFVNSIAIQTNGNILVGGNFTQIGGQARTYVARFTANGVLDAGFNQTVNNSVYSLVPLADGKILIGGDFFQVAGQTRIGIARLNSNGSLDSPFNALADDYINTVAVQADGKILIGGFFTTVSGQSRQNIARLNADSSLDSSFNQPLDDSVSRIIVQSDGKILLSGFFSNVGGQPRSQLARLKIDGSLDAEFNISVNNEVLGMALQNNGSILLCGKFTDVAGLTRNRISRVDRGGNLDKSLETVVTGDVRAIAFGADKIMIIAGDFLQVDGQTRNRIAKITPAGPLDPTYNPNSNRVIHAILAEKSGSVLVVGGFTSIGGLPRSGISKLKTDGSSDPAFSANTNAPVKALVKLPTGKILIAGEFTQVDTQPINRLALLNPNGSVDTSFNPNVNGKVNTIKKQLDGKIIIAGEFTMVGTAPAQRIARLHANGTVDTTFSPSINGPVKTVTIQPNGKILAGGAFSDVSGVTRNNIVRLEMNGSVDSSYNPIIDDSVEKITVSSDNQTIVGGDFENVNGQINAKVVYLKQDGATSNKPKPRVANTTYAMTQKEDKVNFGAGENSNDPSSRTIDRTAASQGLGSMRASRSNDEVEIKYSVSGTSAFKHFIAFETSINNGTTWVNQGTAAAAVGTSFASYDNFSGVVEPNGVEYTLTGLNLPPEQNFLIRIGGTDEDSGSYEEEIFAAYITAPQTQPQSITITNPAPPAAYVGSKFDVAATASSGLPVAITATANCFVFSGGSNGSATIIMGGALSDCTINYDQAGDGTYDPAPTVTSTTFAEDCPVISTPVISSLTNVPITIPITTSALSDTTSPNIYAATTTFKFDPTVLQFVNARAGAVSPTASLQFNETSPGTVVLSLSSASALNGAGSLVDLNFNVIGAIGSSTPLTVSSFQFNEAITLAVCSTIAPARFLMVESGTISGNVNYANGAGQPNPVPGVTINAAGTPVVSNVSDGNGDYFLANFGAGSYTVSPSKARQADPSNGFSAGDASQIAKHVVGLVTLGGNQAISADVTEDGTISSLDAAFVAQYIVGIVNSNNRTGIWRFTPNSTTPDTTIHSVQNYDANLLGDVTGDWSNTGAPLQARIREEDPAAVSVSNRKAAVNSIAVVPFKIEDLKGRGITSYQFEVKYDPAALEPVKNAAVKSGTISENMFVVSNAPDPGLLKVVVFNALPVTGDGIYLNLKFRVTGKAGTSTKLEIKNLLINDGTTPAAITHGELLLTDPLMKESFGGRVLSQFGIFISGAQILLESTTGEQFEAYSDILGRFQFAGLTPGETYSVSVEAKSHKFNRQVISITENMTDIELIARQ